MAQIDDRPPPPIPVLNQEYMWYVCNRPPGMKDRFRQWMEWSEGKDAPYGTTAEGLPIHGPVEWKQIYPISAIGSHIINRTREQKQDFLTTHGFEFIRELGTGSYGEVWLVHLHNKDNPRNPHKFACKVLELSHFDKSKPLSEYVRTVKNESLIQKFLKHENIVRIENVIHMNDEERGINCIVSYLFMELCHLDLHKYIYESGHLTENLAKYWFKQIASAVKYMHDWNVSHMDIKPLNIMIKYGPNGEMVFKLTDFGMAQMCRMTKPNIGTEMRGSPIYMPPEVWTIPKALLSIVVPFRYDTKASDVYSLGISLLHSLSGTKGVLGQFLLGYVIPKNVFLGSGLSGQCVDLIYRMTDWDPKKRLTMDQVIQHPWLH